MISEAQHADLLVRLAALEAVLVAAKIAKPRELRLAQQRAAKRLKREEEQTQDWIRRQRA